MVFNKINLLVFSLTVLFASTLFAQTSKPALLRFSDLQKYDPTNQTFQIEGYVLDIYKCPPCPPRAMCKPCIPDNVTIVDTVDWKDLSKLKRLRVYTDKTDKFVANGKYLLTVKIKGNLQAGQPVESVDLISIDSTSSQAAPFSLRGNWSGTSLCTIKDSPCHDELVVYHISEPDGAGKLTIQADKLVSGHPEEMGTIDCTFDSKTSKLMCPMKNGIWEFVINGSTITGTLKLPDGRRFRNISVKKEGQD